MRIYDALVSDHEKVKGLLVQLVNLQTGDEKKRDKIIEKIEDDLIPHARAEEAVFYNSIRAVNAAKDLVWHGYAEHMEAESLLHTLKGAAAIDVGWRKTALKLQEALLHHIQEEEEEIIPVAKRLFTDEEAKAMGDAFAEMKPQVLDGGFIQSSLDLIANLMPPRLAAPLRTFTLKA
ncbi:MAG TPA: hemerythrin domain-containing protein [Bdellovibrionales bacterium]|nr:hemerythrin domain-containing protein [Bdellovibrionales bacterium]